MPGQKRVLVTGGARIFNTYGPRMHPNGDRVVSNFIVEALEGRPLTIVGDGSQTQAFRYVEDLIDGLVRLMKAESHSLGEPVNLGNRVEMSILSLAERVVALTGSTSGIEYKALPADVQRCTNITCARTLLGRAPAVTLEEGLWHIIAYFRRLGEPDHSALPIGVPGAVAAE